MLCSRTNKAANLQRLRQKAVTTFLRPSADRRRMAAIWKAEKKIEKGDVYDANPLAPPVNTQAGS